MTQATDQPQPNNASDGTPKPVESYASAPLDKQIDDIIDYLQSYDYLDMGEEEIAVIRNQAKSKLNPILAKAEKKGRIDEFHKTFDQGFVPLEYWQTRMQELTE